MSDFSRAFIAAYERMPVWRRDQFEAHMRDAVVLIERMCELMERLGAEGIEAAERHANGEGS